MSIWTTGRNKNGSARALPNPLSGLDPWHPDRACQNRVILSRLTWTTPGAKMRVRRHRKPLRMSRSLVGL